MNLYKNNIYFEIIKKVQRLNTYMYIVWVSALYRAFVPRDLQCILSMYIQKEYKDECLADMKSLHRQGMLCAPLQHVSLVTQLAS